MGKLRVNKLRHQITIEKNAGTQSDGAGNRIPVWEPLFTTWAEVRPLRGDEIETAALLRQEITHMVTIRYRNDFTRDKHRVNFNGRILAIETIINKDELNVELNIQCREG